MMRRVKAARLLLATKRKWQDQVIARMAYRPAKAAERQRQKDEANAMVEQMRLRAKEYLRSLGKS